MTVVLRHSPYPTLSRARARAEYKRELLSSRLLIELYYAALPVVRALWKGCRRSSDSAVIQSAVRQRSDTKRRAQTCESISCSVVLRSGGLLPVTFLGVTRAHVMPTFARVARNNCIPKRDGNYTYTNYLRDATRNYLPRAKALGNERAHTCARAGDRRPPRLSVSGSSPRLSWGFYLIAPREIVRRQLLWVGSHRWRAAKGSKQFVKQFVKLSPTL